jgi:CHAT domain-containing protein
MHFRVPSAFWCHNCSDQGPSQTAALQLAGYRHVIGTLWSVADAAAADVVYRTLTAGNRPSATAAAGALTAAAARLRAKQPDRPDAWAAFVHLGP